MLSQLHHKSDTLFGRAEQFHITFMLATRFSRWTTACCSYVACIPYTPCAISFTRALTECVPAVDLLVVLLQIMVTISKL